MPRMSFAPVNTDHISPCEPGDHLVRTSSDNRYRRHCTVCDHSVNRDDVALPDSDCPDSCFEQYADQTA